MKENIFSTIKPFKFISNIIWSTHLRKRYWSRKLINTPNRKKWKMKGLILNQWTCSILWARGLGVIKCLLQIISNSLLMLFKMKKCKQRRKEGRKTRWHSVMLEGLLKWSKYCKRQSLSNRSKILQRVFKSIHQHIGRRLHPSTYLGNLNWVRKIKLKWKLKSILLKPLNACTIWWGYSA